MFMNKTSIGSAVAAALLALCASSASAQQSADITIDGTFVPPTCSVSLASGGALDWGTITRQTAISYSGYGASTKIMPSKTVQLDVTCQNATVVGLDWTDNRAASRLVVDFNDPARFGLANANVAGQAFGGYTIAYGTPTTTTGGAITATFVQPSVGGAWSTTGPIPIQANRMGVGAAHPGYVTAFGRTATSATTPLPLVNYSTLLTVQPYFSTAIVTNSTSTIVFDGSATVTLKYF